MSELVSTIGAVRVSSSLYEVETPDALGTTGGNSSWGVEPHQTAFSISDTHPGHPVWEETVPARQELRLPESAERKRYEKKVSRDLAHLLTKTKKYISITSSNLDEDTWLEPKLLSAISRAARKGVKIRLIIGPNSNQKSIRRLLGLGVEIYVARKPPLIDFAVTDNNHIRYEGIHREATTPVPRNKVFLHMPESAARLKTMFEELRMQARSQNYEKDSNMNNFTQIIND